MVIGSQEKIEEWINICKMMNEYEEEIISENLKW